MDATRVTARYPPTLAKTLRFLAWCGKKRIIVSRGTQDTADPKKMLTTWVACQNRERVR